MPSSERLHALDAVRAYALLLGVVLHSAAAFLEGFPIPFWVESPATVPTVAYYVIHMFRMTTFFFIAGFFARMVVERRGVKAFVKDRGKRIAIPLFGFGPFVLISISVGLALGALVHGTEYLQTLMQQMAVEPQAAAAAETEGSALGLLAHMWFLYYLLLFYGLTLIARSIVHAVDGAGRFRAFLDRFVAVAMSGIWAPVVVAAPLVAYFLANPAWNEWVGLPAPAAFVPNLDALVGYGVAFWFGWLLHRQAPLLFGLQKTWPRLIGAAVLLTVVCLSIAGLRPNWAGSTLEGWERTAYTMAYMLGIWCWTFGLVGAAVRYLSHESRVNRYLADASYWIYLMHMSTIVFFLTLLRPYELHWSIKLTVYVVGSMPILLVSYHYLVRFTWIGAVLNGRRHPRPTTRSAAPQSAQS